MPEGPDAARADPHGAGDLLLELAPIAEHLDVLVHLAAAQLGGSCALMLRIDGQLCTVATSDARAEAMSDWQFAHLAGPSLDAMDDDVPVFFLAGPRTRWPDYAREAAGQRFVTSLSVPLLSAAMTIGALTAYRDRPEPFGPAQQHVAQHLAEQACGAVEFVLRVASDKELSAAVASQSVIDTAVGMLMAREGHDVNQALAALRADATARGLELVQVAGGLVTAIPGE